MPGSNAWYDQILQFAAIRTDDDLNELKRFEVSGRLWRQVLSEEAVRPGAGPEVLLRALDVVEGQAAKAA